MSGDEITHAGSAAQDPGLAPGAREAIHDLVSEFAWLIDHGQADRVADLFTEDGCLLGIGEDLRGRAAIAAWGGRRAALRERTSRHCCGNVRVQAEAPDRARATVLLTLFRRDGPSAGPATPLLVGDYEDIYQRGPDGRWRFHERRLVILFGP